MKRLVGITGVILIVCLFASTFFAPVSLAESTETLQTQCSTQAEDVFVIKAENNRIVVYKKGGNEPYLTTDSPCDNLPRADIVYLENGIEVVGRENLRKALQDYCS